MKIEVTVELPDWCDEQFLRLLARLTPEDLAIEKARLAGVLLRTGKISQEEAEHLVCGEKSKKD